jgi:hypothetical protein
LKIADVVAERSDQHRRGGLEHRLQHVDQDLAAVELVGSVEDVVIERCRVDGYG